MDRFGPDVEWVCDASDYKVDPRRSEAFYDAIRAYWPGLEDGNLVADYSGEGGRGGGVALQMRPIGNPICTAAQHA